MEAFDGFEDKEFDLLNEAILKAIVSSSDVERVLQHFKSKDLINEMAVVNLIVSLEELFGLMLSEAKNQSTPALDSPSENRIQEIKNHLGGNTPKGTSPNSNTNDLVDGKVLKRNEILFEKYFQGRFNEKQWLKRSKIQT
ncbi:MAG TPA: hypothetical protein EYQ84_04825 [Nitrospinaceae bacterium]|jgi:hypothetical protein|nr:hypothetical protein [Nitrospinaceae bacterium]